MVHRLTLFLLFLLVFLRPLISGIVNPSSNLYYLFLLSLISLLFLYPEGKTRPLGKEEKLWITFLLWSFITLFWSVNLHSTLLTSLLFLSYFYIFYITKRRDKKEKEILLYTLLFSTFLVSLYGIYQYFWGLERTREFVFTHMDISTLSPDFLSRLQTQRAFSTFVYPPAFAGYLILFIPLTFLLAREKEGTLRYMFIFLGGLELLALFLTKSKGGIFSLILSILIFSLFFFRGRKRLLSLIMALLLFSPFLHPGFRKIWRQSFGVRVSYWKAGWRMVRERPLRGFGTGTFGRVFPRYKEPGREDTQMAHNNYLQVFSEMGLPGGLLFLALLGVTGRRVWRNRENPLQQGIILGYLSFLIHSLIDFDLYIPGITFSLFLLLGMGIYEEKEEKSRGQLVGLIISFLILAPLSLRISRSLSLGEEAGLQMRRKEWRKALGLFNQALSYYPWGEDITRISYHFRKGEIFLLLGEEEKAIQEFRKAVRLDPYRFFYWEKLAMIYFSRGEYDKAKMYMEKAIFYYPSHPRLKKEMREIENALRGRKEK